MQTKFQAFFENNNISVNDRFLLAVSGGVDSVVLSFLCKKAGLRFGIAHFNYQLREVDSEQDEEFVRKLAKDYQVPVFVNKTNTKLLAQKKKTGIQELARNLRYTWFKELITEHNFQWILTAHHLNDSIETIMLNLIKGTGIRGLRGIPILNQQILRPLTKISREEIEAFAVANKLSFREDISNQSDDYQRNYVRHHLIPVMKKLNPSLENTFIRNISNFKETGAIYENYIQQMKLELLIENGWQVEIKIKKLLKQERKKTILFELISDYGFNNTFINPILKACETSSSAQFYSSSHRLITNRTKIIIIKLLDQSLPKKCIIKQLPSCISLNRGLISFEISDCLPTAFDPKNQTMYLDASKIKLPLLLRKWEPGDRFQPYGQNGQHKNVSDLLNDHKLNPIQKENTWILESDNLICAVVGIRPDHRFRLEKKSKTVLKITMNNNHLS